MQSRVYGGICATGGSISRLSEEVYREAADLAHFFHWQRGDIMGMSARERRIWLAQVDRILSKQKELREKEAAQHAEHMANIRARGTG